MKKKQNCGKCYNFNYEYLYSSYNKSQIHSQNNKTYSGLQIQTMYQYFINSLTKIHVLSANSKQKTE